MQQHISLGSSEAPPRLLRRIARLRANCRPQSIRYPDELKRDISQWLKCAQLSPNEGEKQLGIPAITLRSWSASTPALRVVEVQPQKEGEKGIPHEPLRTPETTPGVGESEATAHELVEVIIGSQTRVRLPLSALNQEILQTFANLR
jgi:hypothetical protein